MKKAQRMKKTDRILNELFVMAQDVVPCGNARIAAAVLYKRQIVGFGTNSRKSSPLQKRYGRNDESVYNHAEVSAIRNAINRMGDTTFLRSSTLLVARAKIVDGRWRRGLAEPCSGCYRCLDAFGVSRVEWSEDQ